MITQLIKRNAVYNGEPVSEKLMESDKALIPMTVLTDRARSAICISEQKRAITNAAEPY